MINVGTATIAAFIGAGGYGERIVTGLALNDHAMLLAGAIPAAGLALLIESAFRVGERWTVPAGLRLQTMSAQRSNGRRFCVAMAVVAVLTAFTIAPGAAIASDALWALLKGGGQVVLLRHAITTPGVGDPPAFRLDDCSTQRNLTDEGRRQSRSTGDAFRKQGIAVDRVLSSPWCRCIETARLAFGSTPAISEPLSNLFGRHENQARQVTGMKELAGNWRGKGNLVLVSHGSTIVALTDVSPDFAEMVVVTPQGNGNFAVAGRLVAYAR